MCCREEPEPNSSPDDDLIPTSLEIGTKPLDLETLARNKLSVRRTSLRTEESHSQHGPTQSFKLSLICSGARHRSGGITSVHLPRRAETTHKRERQQESISPTQPAHHGTIQRQRATEYLPAGHTGRRRRQSGQPVDIRRPRRLARRHLRPTFGSEGRGHQRGHALPRPMAAKEHHLRRAHQAPHDRHHDWVQGPADGQLDPEGATQA